MGSEPMVNQLESPFLQPTMRSMYWMLNDIWAMRSVVTSALYQRDDETAVVRLVRDSLENEKEKENIQVTGRVQGRRGQEHVGCRLRHHLDLVFNLSEAVAILTVDVSGRGKTYVHAPLRHAAFHLRFHPPCWISGRAWCTWGMRLS